MVFSAPMFLFLFLPATLAIHAVLPRSLRNLFLLASSLWFYAWGEKAYIVVLLSSIALNYCIGLLIERLRRPRARGWGIAVAVAVNLGLLGSFKYANFLADNLNPVLFGVHLPQIVLGTVHLPLGISFFTFHALSYVIDVSRREVLALRNPVDFALYIAFFPQSIAGPIVRYHDLAEQLVRRSITHASWTAGVSQFIFGLAKKMLIANTLAVPADAIFGLPPSALTCSLAWLGAVSYMLQIYFDFSGYSDMAIGLARLFGFEFRANFDYPYTARSVTEFWRRWHISLSGWFRDYLYIPLGGNRHGTMRTYFNLVAVFFLCGLWHGASWTFVVWGLYHGAFLVGERMGLGESVDRQPSVLRRGYLLLVVLVGWVFFRAGTFGGAVAMLRAMVGLADATAVEYGCLVYLQRDVVLALIAGVICAGPVLPSLRRTHHRVVVALAGRRWLAEAVEAAGALGAVGAQATLLCGSAMLLAANTYNPFIYFRF
jgi:alginate O-acetyltransferase complex protein AlgI